MTRRLPGLSRRVGRIPVWYLLPVLVLAAGVFVGGRALTDGGPAVADQPSPHGIRLPGPDVTPEPGSTPDTSVPYWYVPYQNADNKLPRADQEVAGVLVGPTAAIQVAYPERCDSGGYVSDFSKVASSPLSIAPSFLPAQASVDFQEATDCDDFVLTHELIYFVHPEDGVETRIRSGEVDFFESEHGGQIRVFRARVSAPAFPLDVPTARWTAGTVAGHPAALARPILDGGYGEAAVVVWDAASGVMTAVVGHDRPLSELLQFAEGLYC